MAIPEPEVYEQDNEMGRHNDGLRWSRFQTVALVEGGLAYITWGAEVGYLCGIIISVGALILVFLLALLSKKDEADYTGHLNRIKDQEKMCAYPFKPVKRWWYPIITGRRVMPVAWIILLGFNALIVVRNILGRNF
jgi:hypothetical protein